MIVDWPHAAAPALAAFLASLVEAVEALTVVLAVGAVRGWRGALGGTGLALLVLLGLLAALGPALTRIPLATLQLALGTLLLLFGMRWLRKAILRAAGVIALHDEGAAYAKTVAALRAAGWLAPGFDRVAVSTAFQITMVEGVEVVFIVLAVGATGGSLLPAGMGAAAAVLLVAAAGWVLHRPVARVPENALKFVVGVLLCGSARSGWAKARGWDGRVVTGSSRCRWQGSCARRGQRSPSAGRRPPGECPPRDLDICCRPVRRRLAVRVRHPRVAGCDLRRSALGRRAARGAGDTHAAGPDRPGRGRRRPAGLDAPAPIPTRLTNH